MPDVYCKKCDRYLGYVDSDDLYPEGNAPDAFIIGPCCEKKYSLEE